MLAERILTLGGSPLHTFQDYLENNTLHIGKSISNDEEALALIIKNISNLLIIERKILKISDESHNEGTNSMMSDFIAEQEKLIWMLNAWLVK